jgi:hypothetical protein
MELSATVTTLCDSQLDFDKAPSASALGAFSYPGGSENLPNDNTSFILNLTNKEAVNGKRSIHYQGNYTTG